MSLPMTHHWIPDDTGMECEACGVMLHVCPFNENKQHLWGVSGDCYICGSNQYFCSIGDVTSTVFDEASDLSIVKLKEIAKSIGDKLKKEERKPNMMGTKEGFEMPLSKQEAGKAVAGATRKHFSKAYESMNELSHDPVHNPSHYVSGDVECIDAIRAALGHDGFVNYCRGQAIKYVWRAPLKSDHVEDLNKAAWYINRAIQELG